MRRAGPDLIDEDLARLARLGGSAAQISEAAGVDVAQVRRRLRQGRRAEGDDELPPGAAALDCAARG